MSDKKRASAISTVLSATDFTPTKNQDEFSVVFANTLREREEVFRLAYKIYLEKGYVKENSHNWLISEYDANPNTAILVVKDKDGRIVGSATMVFDGNGSIPAADTFPREIEQLRDEEERIVEISRLVIDHDFRNAKAVLVKLFNYLYIYSYFVKDYTCLAVEVNPRHKKYYQSLLAFEEIADEVPCHNVQDAPAVLLFINLWRDKEEIFSDLKKKTNEKTKCLYPYFLSEKDEARVAIFMRAQFSPITEDEKEYFMLEKKSSLGGHV